MHVCDKSFTEYSPQTHIIISLLVKTYQKLLEMDLRHLLFLGFDGFSGVKLPYVLRLFQAEVQPEETW